MSIHNHLTALTFAGRRLRETPLTSFLTIMVIAIALTLPTSLSVILQNFKVVTPLINSSRQITLYLNTNTKPQEIQALITTLNNNQDIAKVNYISAEQGLDELQKNSGLSSTLGLLKDNPLPPVIVVTPKANLVTTNELTALLNQLKAAPEVKNATLDAEWLSRLHYIFELAKYSEVILFILFSLAVLIIIGNTIRLTLQSAAQEIAVLKLVGATKGFIRRQFLYLGLGYGILGGLATWLIVSIIVHALNFPIAKLATSYNSDFVLQGLTLNNILALLVLASILGIAGALVSIHEQLKSVVSD